MLKERARIVATGLLASDLLLVAGSFLAAYWLRSTVLPALGLFPDNLYPLRSYLPLLPVSLVIWGFLLYGSGVYGSQRTVPLPLEAWHIARTCSIGAVLLVLVIFVFRLDESLLGADRISRLWIGLFVTLAGFLLLGRMVLVRLTARWVRFRGYNYRTILIVGCNETGLSVAESIDRHSYWGYRIMGFISENGQTDTGRPFAGRAVLGELGELPEILESRVVDEVIFALDRQRLHLLEDLMLGLEEQGIRTRLALNLFPHAHAKVEVGDLDGLPLMTFSTTPTSELRMLAKRALDVVASSILLVLSLPAMLLVALLIKLGRGGTVLFRQTRCGLNGRLFTLYKFRTMIQNAEAEKEKLAHLNEMGGPAFKVRSDPRVTRLGRVLRRFSLDELPQLWNVLRGDMSLVGPRPPVPAEVAQYQRWQRRRLSMRPGLTCLWQISGRNQVDFDRWMELDLEYIDNWTPSLDLKILAKTIPAVLSGRGAS